MYEFVEQPPAGPHDEPHTQDTHSRDRTAQALRYALCCTLHHIGQRVA
jgi:hypothetical protein